MREIGFGIIGGGLMGREFASAVARWDHLIEVAVRPRIVGVADRSATALDYFAQSQIKPAQLVMDYRELLKNSAIHAIYAAVPHDLHQQVYVDCLRAGKHLLGEKPFGIDQAANAIITQEATKYPELIVRCSSEFPYWPGAQRIISMIRNGEMGRILEVECGLLHSSDMDPKKPINWKRRAATNGEYGCMGDLGMHVMHVPIRVGWKIRNLRAILTKVFTERPASAGSSEMVACETWDNTTLFCEAAGGIGERFPLTAKMMRIAPGETNTWYLSVKGTALSARFSTRQPRSLFTLAYMPGKPQTWQEEQLGYESVYKTITGHIFEFGFGDTMLQMIAAFCDQIDKGPDAQVPFGLPTPEEAAATHAIFTAALRSQQLAQTVQVQ
jgi:predicted dehydrogenase